MRLLIDINVLLDVPLQRPGAPASAQVLAQCGRQHEAWLAWHSLATLSCLIERQKSHVSGRELLAGLLVWADVVPTTRADALAALQFEMPDLEDALQATAAVACKAQFILTRNERDFKKSPVPAINPEAFLRRFPL